MSSEPTSRSETLRGTIVAIALVAIGLSVFLVFALGKHVHVPELHAKPKPPERPPQRAEESSAKSKKTEDDTVAPGSGGHGGGDGGSGGGGGGAGGGGAAQANYVADNVRDALHGVLESYRADPRKTSVVSISSGGQVRLETGGPLTSLDGLPANAVRRGTLLDGAPVGDPAIGPR
jgi:hypothetical protein